MNYPNQVTAMMRGTHWKRALIFSLPHFRANIPSHTP